MDEEKKSDHSVKKENEKTKPVEKSPEGNPEGHKTAKRTLMEIIAAAAAVILVLLWLAGTFGHKVKEEDKGISPRSVPSEGVTFKASLQQIPNYESSVGTIQSVQETTLGSKLLAKVISVNIKAGQSVKTGEILMRLDDKDLKARVSQARSSVDQSKARYNQAKVEYDRVMAMAKENAASQHEIDTVQNQIREAEAQLRGSEESLSEAETILSYATIKSPYDATIIDKTVDTGDTVTPGQTLAKLYNPRKMQLVATVRESLATSLHVGQKLPAYISSMKLLCEGTISEIVPQAESQSRSFDVKLVGPCPPGIYSGMFGRIFIPRGSEEVILIPTSAVTTVGQLSLVDLIRDGHLVRQSIQIGRTFDDQAEVLSGLNSGDTLWMKNALPTSTTHPDGKKWILESLDAEGACPVVPNQK